MRVLIAVLVVAACAWGLVLGWRHLVPRACRYVEDVVAELAAQSHTEVSRFTDSFDLEGAPRLTIENDFGPVEVRPGGPQASVSVVVHARGKEAVERARAAEFSLAASRDSSNGCNIEVVGSRHPRVRVDLIAEVPPDIALQLQLTSGRARVMDRTGPVNIASGSGAISVSNLAGGVTAHTRSGAIGVERVQGGATATTRSGRIELTDIEGTTVAETSSGRVSLRAVQADEISATSGSGAVELCEVDGHSIKAITRSGSIRVSLSRPLGGDMTARSGSGSIRVMLPTGSNCDVRATSGSGSVRSELPLSGSHTSRHEVGGTLGAGRGRVEIGTRSGAIRLAETVPMQAPAV